MRDRKATPYARNSTGHCADTGDVPESTNEQAVCTKARADSLLVSTLWHITCLSLCNIPCSCARGVSLSARAILMSSRGRAVVTRLL